MKDCNLANTPSKFSLKLHKDLKGNKVDNTLYKQIFGSLMYLTPTRPDIMYSVSMISRYIEEPTKLICWLLNGSFATCKEPENLGYSIKG